MRNPDEITSDIEDLNNRIESMEAEIPGKKESLQKLKEGNAKLLAKYAGKDRKPQSLNVQTRNIRDLEIELEQLQAAIPILEANQGQLADELLVAEAAQELAGYYEKSRLFFGKIETAIKLLEDMIGRTAELEEIVGEIRSDNPLYQLNDIFGELETEAQFNALEFREGELTRYRFLGRIVPLEKRLPRLIDVVKGFSDFAFGLEYIGLRSLKIPEGNQGPVYVGGGGPKTRVESGEASEIERHPERYSEADVRKHGIQVANRK